MAHPPPQSKEQQGNVSNPITPLESPAPTPTALQRAAAAVEPAGAAGPRAPLAWAPWPAAAAPLRPRAAPLWAEVLRSWPAAVRVALLAEDHADRRQLPMWCALLQRHRRVPALALAPQQCTPAWLAALPDAPLLLVLQGSAATPAGHWRQAIAALARHRQPRHRWATLGAPLCHLPAGDASSPVAGDLALQQPRSRLAAPWPPVCQGCAAQGLCPGPAGEPAELAPLPRAVTNQFDLLLGGDGPRVGWLAEPVESPEQAEQIKHAALQPLTLLPGQIAPSEVDTALARQQLYRDRSSAARIGDFAAELQLLGQRADGVWQASAQPPFAREEQQLMAHLRQLCQRVRGRAGVVVDVGAGPVRYIAALAEAVSLGQLHYIAVEPDVDQLRRSAAAFGQGLFVRGVAEQLPLASASADAVMMLRSWNHLRDPLRALAEVRRVLRPGGRLLVVDNVVFGLVRDRDQLRRAHALPLSQTPYEHFRNHAAAEAWALLQQAWGAEARLLDLQEVAPGTSNQWLLLLQRGDSPAAPGH